MLGPTIQPSNSLTPRTQRRGTPDHLSHLAARQKNSKRNWNTAFGTTLYERGVISYTEGPHDRNGPLPIDPRKDRGIVLQPFPRQRHASPPERPKSVPALGSIRATICNDSALYVLA